MPVESAIRRRRSSGEVRRLVLEAAEALFAERGYHAATTREIARRAGVTEQVLFNNFASKERLFAATVLEPFDAFAREHLETWRDVSLGALDPEQMLSDYIADLYRLVVEHRELFLALGEDRFGAPVELILASLDVVAAEMAALHGYRFDAAVGVRIVFAATTTLALHGPDLLSGRSSAEVLKELQATLVAGVLRPR
jgi:AcrR family transcriptional regulator